jgi:hypothetical protein
MKLKREKDDTTMVESFMMNKATILQLMLVFGMNHLKKAIFFYKITLTSNKIKSNLNVFLKNLF